MNEETTQVSQWDKQYQKDQRDFVQTSEIMYMLSVLRQKWSEMRWAVSAGLSISQKLCQAEQELLCSETAKKCAG